MSQTFINLPLSLSGEGPGAAVAIPASSPHKTFLAAGNWKAFNIALEISANGLHWDKVGSFLLEKNPPQTFTFSTVFARVNVTGLISGTPTVTLAVDTVVGSTSALEIPLTGVPVNVNTFENKHKTFIVSATPANLDGVIIVDGAPNATDFDPLFIAQGQDRDRPYSFDGYLKYARARRVSGNTQGMRVDIVTEPFTCAGLNVIEIIFNNDPDQLTPGFPQPSDWCFNEFVNPPLISITFDRPFDPASVTGATVFLTGPGGGGVAIGPYSFSGGNTVISFTPSAPLTANVSAYNVHVVGVTTPDFSIVGPVTFPFTVENCEPQLVVDDIVFNNNPAELTPGYPTPSTWSTGNTDPPLISITFNEPINPATVTGASVFMTGPGGSPFPIGAFSFSGGNTIVSFTPTSPLLVDPSSYNIHVTSAVQTPLATGCTPVNFAVVATALPLTVIDIVLNDDNAELTPGYPTASTWCENQFTNPPEFSIVFSSAIDPATITGATLFLTDPSSVVVPIGAYSFSGGNTVVKFTPTSPLVADPTSYVVHATAGIKTPLLWSCTPVTFSVQVEDCGPVTFKLSPYVLNHDQESPPIIIPTGVESVIGHETHCVVDWDALPGTQIQVNAALYNQFGGTFRVYIGGTPPPGSPNNIVGTLVLTAVPLLFGYTNALSALVAKPTGLSMVILTGQISALSSSFTHAQVGILPDPSEGLILSVDTEAEELAGTSRLVSWEVDFTRFASTNLLFALAGLSNVDTAEAATVTIKVGGTFGVDDGTAVASFPITTNLGTVSGVSATIARPVGIQPVKVIVTGHASGRMLYDSLIIIGVP